MATFQGKPVALTKIQFVGGAKEIFDEDMEVDQIVSINVDGRVSGVSYTVNEKTGDLEQVVKVKVIDVADIKTESYPRLVTVDNKQINPETGEVVNG